MKHRKIKVNRDILVVAVLALVLVATWVVITVFNIYQQPTNFIEIKKFARPINPKLDEQVFANLSQRLQVDPGSLPDQLIVPETTPPAVAADAQRATTAASLTPAPSSEPAGSDLTPSPSTPNPPAASASPTLAP